MTEYGFDYLRKHWDCVEITDRYRGGWRFYTANALYRLPIYPSQDELISAAVKFTRQRLEEIRQVEEEIDVTKFHIDCYTGRHTAIAIQERILARLQAALSELKEGMISQ